MRPSVAIRDRADGGESRPPLVVDLDRTLLRSDTLHETFVAALFRNPLVALLSVLRGLFSGRARLKQALGRLGSVEIDTLPLRGSLIAYLQQEKRSGRSLHLATAADRTLAQAVADRLGLFEQVFASDGRLNLKGEAKARALEAAFPQGFSYAGDCPADLPVWRAAQSAVVVASPQLARKVADLTELEHHIDDDGSGWRVWLSAARPHQWTKNLMLLVPAFLGWPQATPLGLARTMAAFLLMCAVSSFSYILNDLADVQSDRRHATKRRRPFATGALQLGQGLVVGALGLGVALAAAWPLAGPGAALCLFAYTALTLAYSLGLKRSPLLDCMVIGALFTLRIAAGVTAGALLWSPWLLTFSLTLFFSLALAKRHTELVAGGGATGPLRGRGYRYEDRGIVLAFGVAAATLSILIVVLYLMQEVFPRGAYRHPLALWAEPPLIFLWSARIWLLANRGEMNDDPVVFALRDRMSHVLAAAAAVAFLVAVI